MFSLLGLGMLMIVTNYLGVLPGWGQEHATCWSGSGCITGGFITATRYH